MKEELMVESSFWSGKRVLVTGHTGFKGAWLTYWLNELGAKVQGIALEPSTEPSLFNALNLASKCEHNVLDIRDSQKVAAAMAKGNPQLVFHMAAQPLVRLSYEQPLETYQTNVMGTGHVLMGLKGCPSARAAVVVTTDKCYENREWHYAYRETDPLGGYDPYSSSKAAAEILTASFRRSFFAGGAELGIATARAGNVIGGGDWSADRLIPDIVRSYTSNQQLEIRYPEAIRPWQHVLMPLMGYMSLAEKLYAEPAKWSEAFNFAPSEDDCVPVRAILEGFGKAWGQPVNWHQTPGQQPHEAHFLKLDSSKAKGLLKWKPKFKLEDALHATATWYREFQTNPKGIETFTKNQIYSAMESV